MNDSYHPDAHFAELARRSERAVATIEANNAVLEKAVSDASLRVAHLAGERDTLANRVTELERKLAAEIEKRVSSEPNAIVEALKRFLVEQPDAVAAALTGLARDAVAS